MGGWITNYNQLAPESSLILPKSDSVLRIKQICFDYEK